MSDITEFAKMDPLRKDMPFRDELNGLMAQTPKTDVGPMVEAFKKDMRQYIADHGSYMEDCLIEFEITLGKVYPHTGNRKGTPICGIKDLPAIKAAFEKESVKMEWIYDRGNYNGKMVFRW